ncbi:MAG: VTT domain-containing protein [Acidobacteria bacterium]|nr:VTT domain-containing protein [Acidobacteriota bacterium]
MQFMQSALSVPRLSPLRAKWLVATVLMVLSVIPSMLIFSPQRMKGFLFIVLATFITEDLTTIHVGMLSAQGSIGFIDGTLACFLGIFVGDMLLYLAGRTFGRAALSRAPLRWFLSEGAVNGSSKWLEKRGALVIAICRFVPGTRLPTYFAAGMLRTSFRKFTFYFLVASAVWTPLLVLLSAWFGEHLVLSILSVRSLTIFTTLLSAFIFWMILRLALKALTWQGRRMLAGQMRKWLRWEFWPPYLFYPPVVAWIGWLSLKSRSLTAFTAANPAIEAGGFIGESKSAILHGLQGACDNDNIARHRLIAAGRSFPERLALAGDFMQSKQLAFPVVLKPNAGQRGAGVMIIRSEAELNEALLNAREDLVIQEYVPGIEFGVFYFRYPGDVRGRIFSITEKVFPEVTGDGVRSLKELILSNDRAASLAEVYFDRNRLRLDEIVPANERVQLVEIGSHCRGTVFLDGTSHLTPELAASIDRISRQFDGFYFGRYDVRVDSIESFRKGINIKVIELNGVTSEATNIYDPRNSVFYAWRVLCRQWSIAFEIAAANISRGERITPVRELIGLILKSQSSSRSLNSDQ